MLKEDQFAENLPGEQWSRRETIEARGTKWNFDVEMDSGIPGPTLEPRRDEGMPTATASIQDASSQQQRRRRCGGQDEDGDLRPILHESCENEGDWQSRPFHNILGAPVSYLPNKDSKLIDAGQIGIAQILLECKNDIYVMMVSWEHCVTSKDGYTHLCHASDTWKNSRRRSRNWS